MKVAIIGAAGGTGQKTVVEALDSGYQVIAVVRDPAKVSLTHENLEVRKGDVLEMGSIEAAIAGADAVVSAIGTSQLKAPITICTRGMANIIRAMRSQGIRRLVAIGASGYVRNPRQSFLIHYILTPIARVFLGGVWDDLERMEGQISKTSLDWTVVRPPRLTNGRLTKKYRTAPETVVGGSTISRSDLAHYMISHLNDSGTFHKAIGVGY